MTPFQSNEKHLSQLPALQLLINMGYEFIDHGEALRERQGRFSNVVLETILHDQLKKINHIHTKGKEYLFSEENIQTAIQKIKHIKYDGLIRTNEAIYDFLTLGTSLEQNIEGDLKSFTLNYVDWDHPENNRFHVTVEYVVERNRSEKTIRPDLVLFVNGFPLVVIECKAPHVDLEEAVSQSIWNQREDYSPGLFIYSQLIMAVNKNEAKYATTGTADRFWAVWKEVDNKQEDTDNETLLDLKNKSLSESVQKSIEQALNCQLPVLSTSTKLSINSVEGSIACPEQGRRVNYQLISEQDKALYALCRPERLLELSSKFIVFDAGIKKIARYQQYFVVKSTLERIQQKDEKGARKGGIIWHTQGSGKSLTMVMLARTLALTPDISNPRIVLVSDRDDLDKQLGNTFDACGLDLTRATSGRNLLSLVSENKSAIITTLIHKFEKAFSLTKYRDNSADIFILIDESHRSQFGTFSARMWQMFPRACYLGFTGTPLLKKDKNNFHKFGNLIEPHYPIAKAVEDGAVVPLLYEGRHIEMIQNKKAIDLWFERHTQGLTKEQQADLKRKYARAEMLNKTDYVIYMRAFDISEHFRATWQGTGFKGQLVAP
ncbi:MAG: HsdR family type I site-specific deoxyribonuclease, partial [Candidatus Marinimicrobia bacterium]|nr:HsdR family type I site-specific deoxyribonuclease [Candidatus Neomarinimicrobiota bacterium]